MSSRRGREGASETPEPGLQTHSCGVQHVLACSAQLILLKGSVGHGINKFIKERGENGTFHQGLLLSGREEYAPPRIEILEIGTHSGLS